MVREIKAIQDRQIVIKDNALEIFEKRITKYGNGAKLDAPKRHLGKRAYIIVLKD